MGCFAEEGDRSSLREQLSSLRTCNAEKAGSVCVREPVPEAGTVAVGSHDIQTIEGNWSEGSHA